MEYLSVNHWEDFQHYKDREPKWIKVYRSLLIDYKFDQLSDAEFGILVKTWLLASQMDNKIPNDCMWLKNKLGLARKPNLNKYIELGFLLVQNGTKPYRQNESSVSKRYTETETDKETDKDKEESDTDFEKFWKIYPKKIGKGSALKAWSKIKSPMQTLEKIIHALEWQKTCDQWIKDNGQFIPHPSTYLNQRRWEDEKQERTDDDGYSFLREKYEKT